MQNLVFYFASLFAPEDFADISDFEAFLFLLKFFFEGFGVEGAAPFTREVFSSSRKCFELFRECHFRQTKTALKKLLPPTRARELGNRIRMFFDADLRQLLLSDFASSLKIFGFLCKWLQIQSPFFD